jgi:CRISPR-associated protein Csh1
VDLLFNGTEAEDFIENTKDSSVFDVVKFYSVNFIVYRTDGNSIDVIETIEDVPTLRIEKIIRSLSNNSLRYGEKTNTMHISDVYRIIPVREDKKHNQINIGRVLDLYKSILCGEIIDSENIYSYANEAMEKGCKQLDKKLMDNYRNMKLQNYKRNDSGNYRDYFIQNVTMKYIAFFKSLQELKLLNKEVFNGEEKDKMGNINTISDDVNKSVNEIEEFLYSQKFSNDAKALFYLGILIDKVAYEQWKRGHKTKPILKKIQFQGMKCSEIYRLYNDVVERLNQYNALDIFNEAYMNRFHLYSGTLGKRWTLSDQANVFYIMAGYSYMVGNTKKQNKELKDNESEGK